MKICIYGAGAIGGLLAAKLARSGQDVTVIARGPHLAAIKARGWDYIGIFMLYGFWLCAALVAFFCLYESSVITDYFP